MVIGRILVAVLALGCTRGTSEGGVPRIELPPADHVLIYADAPHGRDPLPPGSDAATAPGSPFLPGEYHPAVRYVVREPDGQVTHFFLDAGVREAQFRHNRAIDLASLPGPEEDLRPDFLVVSHYHTIFLPSAADAFLRRSGVQPSTPLYEHDGGGLATLLEENPDLRVYVPRLEGFTYDMLPPIWRQERLLERAIPLGEGYHPITDRVGILTRTFSVDEERWLGHDEIPENLVVVRSGDGYLVHAACAHRPARALDGHTPHPAEFLASHMPDPLPALPVRTLLTGACDFPRIARDDRLAGPDRVAAVFARIRERFPELDRIVPVHCGLLYTPSCRRVFGDRCQPGLPGAAFEIPPLDPAPGPASPPCGST